MDPTRGPWKAKEDEYGHWGIYGPCGECIAITEEREDKGNARLIAAAPDLVELCSDLLNPENAVEPIRREVEKVLRRIYGKEDE